MLPFFITNDFRRFRIIDMIVLKELGTDQTFKIIPRSYTADSMVITNETTGESTTYSITITQTDYYAIVTKTVTLKEDNFYSLVVYNGSDVIYKDKIFCTNQTGYSVNNGEYTTYTSNNDYLTYE